MLQRLVEAEAIAVEIARVRWLSGGALRRCWQAVFGRSPPEHFTAGVMSFARSASLIPSVPGGRCGVIPGRSHRVELVVRVGAFSAIELRDWRDGTSFDSGRIAQPASDCRKMSRVIRANPRQVLPRNRPPWRAAVASPMRQNRKFNALASGSAGCRHRTRPKLAQARDAACT
jgi:hypothetical protein